MATLAKKRANRRNAVRSTGPRTPTGKRVASKNSRKHGLRSAETLLPFEDREEFESFSRQMHEQAAAVGELEASIVDQIVAQFWRLRRIRGIEAELMNREFYEVVTTRAWSKVREYEEVEEEEGEDGYSYETTTVTDSERHAEAEKAYDAVTAEEAKAPTALGEGFFRSVKDENRWPLLSRYEAALERSLFRNLHELERLQTARRGGNVPPPLAVDVTLNTDE